MNPQEQNQMSPDEAAASLAFATSLSQQLMPKVQMQDPEDPNRVPTPEGDSNIPIEPQKPQGQELDLEPEKDPQEDMKAEFDDFKKEMKKMVKDEIGSIKDMIKESLNEEEQA